LRAVRPGLKVKASFEWSAGNCGAVVAEGHRRPHSAFESLRAPRVWDLGFRERRTTCPIETDARPVDHFLGTRIVAKRGVTHQPHAVQVAAKVVSVGGGTVILRLITIDADILIVGV